MSKHLPTVFLLPGLLCDEQVWPDQRAALAPHAHCVVPSWVSLSSLQSMAQRVLSEAPERFSVVGHSMGGRVALEVARLVPGRIERMALLDTGIDPLAPGDAGEAERAKRQALLDLARRDGMRAMGRVWARGMVHPDRLDTPVFDAILDMIERSTPEIFAAQINALLNRPDGRGVLASLRCPTVLMCGRDDAWSPLARHEQMHELLPASKLVVIEHSGHMTTMEQPQAVSDALLEWLVA
jgi:pimeloyl-ACP methyl ester carboxylesterase